MFRASAKRIAESKFNGQIKLNKEFINVLHNVKYKTQVVLQLEHRTAVAFLVAEKRVNDEDNCESILKLHR